MKFDNVSLIKDTYCNELEGYNIPTKALSSFLLFRTFDLKYEVNNEKNGYHLYFTRGNKSIVETVHHYRSSFKEGLHILPYEENNKIEPHDDGFILSITQDIRYMSVQSGILCIEKYDYENECIMAKFYDRNVVEYMSENKLIYNSIDAIESFLVNNRIIPDKEVTFKANTNKAVTGFTSASINRINNGESIKTSRFSSDGEGNRTLYSLYYEFYNQVLRTELKEYFGTKLQYRSL